jgi:hypothetical protein
MSNEYLIKKDGGIIVEVWAGRITADEFLDHERQQWLDPDFPNGPKVIVDITCASFDPAITDDEIRQFVEVAGQYPEKSAGAKVAIVDLNDFGRAKMFGKLVRPQGITVIAFNDICTACAWLGVDNNDVKDWVKDTRNRLLTDDSQSADASGQ